MGIAPQAGFSKVSLEVLTRPDTDGRLLGMIRTVADYACDGTQLEPCNSRAVASAHERK